MNDTSAGRAGGNPLWYKDAVIYELHVKAFFDANNDGIGDFAGLRAKLDYLQDLGVDTLWLLPFYPSPQRDDGYDIADYLDVHPSYGTLADFRQLVREAHRRGLRVITELVINHTSDQHPWFQRSRRAPPGSAARDMYIWSDTDEALAGTRIIFSDTEVSNWSWDPVANAWYWHRFFSHQPDLNHNNPRVVQAVSRVMRFWLDMGVDGLRLDAIPYLCVREGTNNENLPETHAVIRELRAIVDRHYEDRLLLAEANQWPEDVREYFGNGDECHMAYHFPLMPRMYMAVALEDRYPVVEILEQTPEIPATCQWAIFLRNHDELTLEMVTDRERDYMYRMYAAEPHMRINAGIRRRLAPLLDNDLDRVSLMNGLLLSMPGTPIIYYGDEIGMGDNVFLGDRNGVRTPMQWSPDRNGGFSRADPQQLYLPPIMDPIYGYGAVNVESQTRDRSSLLNWMKRMLAVRKQHVALGRGELELLHPGNRKILAYLRIHGDEIILCVANLARSAQAVELDLGRHRGRVPVELLSRTSFPPIGELPYLLTLPGYAQYWFLLSADAAPPSWHRSFTIERELPVLVLPQGLDTLVVRETGGTPTDIELRTLERLEQKALPQFLAAQRWFASKSAPIARSALDRVLDWQSPRGRWLLALIGVELEDGTKQDYFVPLTVAWEGDESDGEPATGGAVAKIRHRSQVGVLRDAFDDPEFARAIVDAIAERTGIEQRGLTLRFGAIAPPASPAAATDDLECRASSGHSNSGVVLGDSLFLKGYRVARAGINVELEMNRFLTESPDYASSARLVGDVVLDGAAGEPIVLCSVQDYVRNQGDLWSYTLGHLERFLEALERGTAEAAVEDHGLYLERMRQLGVRTGELHKALARPGTRRAFAPERIRQTDLDRWTRQARTELRSTLAALRTARKQVGATERALIDAVLERRSGLTDHLVAPQAANLDATRTRLHGDFHLGQVLLVRDDVLIIDFEGEPGRTIAERRRKHSPLRDVAGLVRSLAYAAGTAYASIHQQPGPKASFAVDALVTWRREAIDAFLAGHAQGIEGSSSWPTDASAREGLLWIFVIEKALYEVRYELDNRPEWLAVALRGLLELADPKFGITGPVGDDAPPDGATP